MIKVTLQQLNRVDISAFLVLSRLSDRLSVRAVARWLSRLADGPAYLVIGLLLAGLDGERGQLFLLTGLAAYALELPLYMGFKRLFKRARPFVQLNCWHSLVPSDEFSFPSGHTAAAAVFAGLLGYFYVDATGWLAAGVLAVGASRVLLGVHFPGDILAGALLGLVCVSLTFNLLAGSL